MLTTIWCTMVRGDVRLLLEVRILSWKVRYVYYTVEELVIPSGRSLCHLDRFSTHIHHSLFLVFFATSRFFSLLHLLFLYIFLSLQNSDMVPLIYGLFSIKKVPVMTYSLLFLYPANEAFWWEKRQRKDVNKRHREKKTQKRMQEGALNGHGWFHLCGSSWLFCHMVAPSSKT